ncbi:hypothetical protein BKA69DRAFT_925231 [Paraphysoderma sedebokerense]|nr:hypothetical protein BKA69DRAFT_925231 [Paraphysoderma sedebokerense]
MTVPNIASLSLDDQPSSNSLVDNSLPSSVLPSPSSQQSELPPIPVSIKQTTTFVNGIKTDFIVQAYSDAIWVIVSQLEGKVGSLTCTTLDLPAADSLLSSTGGSCPCTTAPLLNVDSNREILNHIYASEILTNILKSNPRERRRLICGLAFKGNQGRNEEIEMKIERERLKTICDVLEELNVW